jgi:hypothetical protein
MAEVIAPRVIAVGSEMEPEALAAYLDKRHKRRTTLVPAADGDILVVKDVWGRPCERYRLLKLSGAVRWQRVA